MKIYAGADGRIVRIIRNVSEGDPIFDISAGSTQLVDFDEETNIATRDGLHANIEQYRVVLGVLQRNGVPVTINPPTSAWLDQRFARTNATAIYAALRAGTATNAQVQRVVAFLLRRELREG